MPYFYLCFHFLWADSSLAKPRGKNDYSSIWVSPNDLVALSLLLPSLLPPSSSSLPLHSSSCLCFSIQHPMTELQFGLYFHSSTAWSGTTWTQSGPSNVTLLSFQVFSSSSLKSQAPWNLLSADLGTLGGWPSLTAVIDAPWMFMCSPSFTSFLCNWIGVLGISLSSWECEQSVVSLLLWGTNNHHA